MLTKKQVNEIKDHLNKAQNPLFFYDNDQDGLCSFLLLQRYLERGKGVCIRSYPDLSVEYFRKVEELSADYIFILDKPIVSKEFFLEAEKRNIPVVWIDHHQIQGEVPSSIYYYNPLYNKSKTEEPVTALCYQITNRKQDLWIAVAGCIFDKHLPKYYKDFEKKYPDLSLKTNNVSDVYYKSGIGKISKTMGFGLMDSISNVVSMQRFLTQVKSPYEFLEDNSKSHSMHYRVSQIESKYQTILKKALIIAKKSTKLIFFTYGGDLSISGDLANELFYTYPEKVIVIVYKKGAKANISSRGQRVREIFLKAIEGIDGARGGGHAVAVGGQMKVEDVDKFRENLESQI